jgi:hypothetical protein
MYFVQLRLFRNQNNDKTALFLKQKKKEISLDEMGKDPEDLSLIFLKLPIYQQHQQYPHDSVNRL